MFVGSVGMLLFFMVSGALRAAGDARTPLRLGVLLTVLNIACNIVFITGVGPAPRLGTAGAAVGTTVAGLTVSGIAGYLLLSGRLAVRWHRGMDWRPDWGIIRALFRFGLPTGVQGIAMNVAGLLLLRFIGSLGQSAQAQAASAPASCSQKTSAAITDPRIPRLSPSVSRIASNRVNKRSGGSFDRT